MKIWTGAQRRAYNFVVELKSLEEKYGLEIVYDDRINIYDKESKKMIGALYDEELELVFDESEDH